VVEHSACVRGFALLTSSLFLPAPARQVLHARPRVLPTPRAISRGAPATEHAPAARDPVRIALVSPQHLHGT
jgi:hypothetical protein